MKDILIIFGKENEQSDREKYTLHVPETELHKIEGKGGNRLSILSFVYLNNPFQVYYAHSTTII